MTVVTNTQAGNFVADGSYVQNLPPQPQTPTGPQSDLIAIQGGASWGPVNSPVAFSDAPSLFAAYGMNTTNVKSLVRQALNAMPECSNFSGNRITDGTDAKAKINIMDTTTPTAAILVTLTAVYSGSLPNVVNGSGGASARVDLANGSTTSPVYNVTIYFPNAPAQVFSVVGYATIGGGFDHATFINNLVAAVNGKVANVAGSPFFTAAAGVSTGTNVVTGSAFNASGGTDGDTGITDTTHVGADTTPATGMYAFRGQIAGGQLVLAGLNTVSVFPTVAQFCNQEGAIGHFGFAQGTAYATAAASKATNSLSNDNMVLDTDYDYVFDQYANQNGTPGGILLTSPEGAIAGIIASEAAWQYPGNKPKRGKQGILSTERLAVVNNGQISASTAISQAEKGNRQNAGLLYLAPTPRGPLGLPHGLTSSGKLISDVRMQIEVGYDIDKIMSNFVGEMMVAGDANDKTIVDARAAVDTYLQNRKNNREISNFKNIMDGSNNTAMTGQQGLLIANVLVTTLSAVQFAVAAIQVGNTVKITTTPVGG